MDQARGRRLKAPDLKLVTLPTGALIAGEAVLLLVALYFRGQAFCPWIRLENEILLVIDLVTGILLLGLGSALAVRAVGRRVPAGALYAPLLATTLLALFAHSYRGLAYLLERTNTFCANGALFFLNNLKLVGLGAVLVSLLSRSQADARVSLKGSCDDDDERLAT